MTTEHVYLIGSSDARLVKIGRTGDTNRRLATIQRMSPVVLSVLWQTPGGSALESALHRRFRERRSHGEWFDFGDTDPLAEVASAIAALSAECATTNAEAEAAYATALAGLDLATDRVAELRNALAIAESDARDSIVTALRACLAAGSPRGEVQKHSPFSVPTVRAIGEEAGIPPDERYVRGKQASDAP